MYKKSIITLVFFASVNLLYSQSPTWHVGFEPTANVLMHGYRFEPGKGLNTFVKYDRYEFYIGADYFFVNKSFGLETGLKYHFISKKRLSHFFIDINFQHNKWTEGVALPRKYSYEPKDQYDDLAMFRIKSYFFSTAMGYEINFTKWFSSTIAVGPGLDYYSRKNTWAYSYTNDKKWRPVLLIKLALRLTINIK